MTKREQRLYEALRRTVHYSLCLETECKGLGNPIGDNPDNTILADAKQVIEEVKAAKRA